MLDVKFTETNRRLISEKQGGNQAEKAHTTDPANQIGEKWSATFRKTNQAANKKRGEPQEGTQNACWERQK